jgi:hypothetical protein
VHVNMALTSGGRRSAIRARSTTEQLARYCHFGHLENRVAAMAHDLRPDLHQLLAQGRERPPLDLARQGQGEVVGERVELEPHRVDAEASHESRVQRIAYLPCLIHCSAVPRPL